MPNYILFKRYVNLAVTPQNGQPFNITGLDAEFRVEKSVRAEPNKCELRIYNLSKSNRQALSSSAKVKLDISAGYEGPTHSPNNINDLERNFLIFHGDATIIYSSKTGPDWITTIATSDGLDSIQQARLNKSFVKGTDLKAIAKDMVSELLKGAAQGVASVLQSPGLDEDFDDQINHSYVSQGDVYGQFQSMMKEKNRDGYFLDGKLVILKKDQFLGQTPIIVSTDTGLVGSPETTNDGFIRFTSLIRPEFNPGYRIEMRSAEHGGLYRIEKLNFTGSTFGQEWYAEIEAKPL